MSKTSTPLTPGVFYPASSAHRCLYQLSAIVSIIIIVAEIGKCGEEPQNPPSSATISIKQFQTSRISINIKDKTPLDDSISDIDAQPTVPKVILNINSSIENFSPPQAFHTIQGKEKKANPTEKTQTTSITNAQTPSATSVNNILRSQFPKPLIASRPASSPETSESKNMARAIQEPKPSLGRITIDMPAPTSSPTTQSFNSAISNSLPKPAPQVITQRAASPAVSKLDTQSVAEQAIWSSTPKPADQFVAQREMPAGIAKPADGTAFQQVPAFVEVQPVSLSINPQDAPVPMAQMAMAGQASQFGTMDPDNKKDNNKQSGQVQQAQPLPQPPSIEGPAPQPENAAPTTPPTTTPANPSDQKLGEAPPDTHLDFLRQQSVLLKPCEWQWDIGFTYVHFDTTFPNIVLPDQAVEGHDRQRLIYMPLAIRYGWSDRVQLFANTLVGWAGEEISISGADEFFNNGGMGDTNAGATILLQKSDGKSCCPDVLATFGFTAPTGRTLGFISIVESPGTTLGQGFWAGFWNVLIIHTYDPVVVFYGFGSRHFFTKEISGIPAKPGDQYNYQLGTGFAVNERITLSTAFIGYYITEASVDNRFVEGTTLEPLYLRFAVTINRPCKRIIEPYAMIGMTDDAANAQVGITWTF